MKRAVITGANRGTGYTLGRTLASAGYQVIALNRTCCHESWLQEIECDLRDRKQVESAIGTILGQYDQIDLLIHNSVVRSLGAIADLTDEAWEAAMQVNVNVVFSLTRRLTPALARAKGTVLIMGSQAGTQVTEGIGAYSVSKAASHALATVLTKELRLDGIRVAAQANCPLPAHVS